MLAIATISVRAKDCDEITNTGTYTPTTETAVVDGFYNDWSLTETSIPMYTGGDKTKPQLSTIYLKQQCNADGTVTVYVLVLAKTPGTVLQSSGDAWVRDNVNPNPIPWDAFAWVNPQQNGTADGYEASFHVSAVGDYLLNFHVEVSVNGAANTSSTTFPNGSCGYVTIHLECKPVTCGLTGVSVHGGTFCAIGDDPLVTATALGTVVGPLKFVWTVPGGPNPGNVDHFTPTVEGTYSVVVTDLGAPAPCSKPGQADVIFFDCTGNGCPVECPATVEFSCEQYPNADGSKENDPDPAVSGTIQCSLGCEASYTDQWIPGCGKSGQIIRVWKCSDGHGLEATCPQIINIVDHSAPVPDAIPKDAEFQCTAPEGKDLTATDNCDGTITASPVDSDPIPDEEGCGYTIERTWTFTDKCGNTTPVKQKLHVKDTIAPEPDAIPKDAEFQCTAPEGKDLTATDNCDGTITASPVDSDPIPDDEGCGYTIKRTWTFTDHCGNSTRVTQTLHVKDTIAPDPDAIPKDAEFQCAVPPGEDLTATDNCDGSITASPVDSDHIPDDEGCGYTVKRTWTFTDHCGNSTPVTQTLHVKDTTAPELTVPADTTVECDAVPVPGEASATDNCDEEPKVEYLGEERTNGNCPSNYTLTRTWRAIDACGNTAEKSQTITVHDTTGPILTLPANTTVECGSSTEPKDTGFATATDACTGCMTVDIYSGFSTTGGGAPYSGLVGSLKAGSISFATDTGYNWHPFGRGSFGADIKGVLNVAADGTYTFKLDSDDGSLLYIDGTVVVDNGGAHAPEVASGSTLLTAGSHKFEVQFFEDFGGPSGVDLILPDGVTYGNGCVSYTDSFAAACGKTGTITRTWTASDACGNTTSRDQTITIVDTTAPVLSGGLGGSSSCGTYSFAPVTISDCDPNAKLNPYTETVVPDKDHPGGFIVTRCWTATDSCGNTTSPDYCQSVVVAPCFCQGKGGLTLGFWSNKNGKAKLQPNDPVWRALLNNLNLVNATGADFVIGSLPGTTFTTAFNALNAWLLNATANNMAYMLSAQLTATTLDVNYNGLADNTVLFIPKTLTVNGANAVAVLTLNGTVGLSKDIDGNGYITINALMAAADKELGLHKVTINAGQFRTYQDVLKTLLDKVNNNQLLFVSSAPCQ